MANLEAVWRHRICLSALDLSGVTYLMVLLCKMLTLSMKTRSAIKFENLSYIIVTIIILMTEKWATKQSCIHIEITSGKIPSLAINRIILRGCANPVKNRYLHCIQKLAQFLPKKYCQRYKSGQ